MVMRILQLDVERIDSEFIKPEAAVYEETGEKRLTVEDALVLFVSIEEGDDNQTAEKAIADTWKFMEKLKRKKLVIYPFAHLSGNLASPGAAMAVVKHMVAFARGEKDKVVYAAPFGWTRSSHWR